MPCEVIPCIVNNTQLPKPASVINGMHENRAKTVQENNMVWTKIELQRGPEQDKDWVSNCGRARNELHTNGHQRDLTFLDVHNRLLPGPFSSLADFEVVEEECEQSRGDHLCETTNWFSRCQIQHCEPPRRYSTSSWPKDTFFREHHKSREFTTQKPHKRRKSEGLFDSNRDSKVFGLFGYRNDSLTLLGKQRTEHNFNTKLPKRERVSESSHITSHNISLSSLDMMSSVATALDQPNQGYHSLPRRLSHPTQVFANEFGPRKNGKQQRNSLPTDSLQGYRFDNDTELQWQRLVARAKTLQLSTPQKKEIIHSSRLSDSNREQVREETPAADRTSGDPEKCVDNKERRMYSVQCVDKEKNNQPGVVRRRRRTEERRYSLKLIPNGVIKPIDERKVSENAKNSEEEEEMTKTCDTSTICRRRCVVQPIDNSNRRHSVAVVRPAQEVKERVSGYSTHGALEYARMLMGKIHEEGKTKSKKERLDEMSKVLKLVLEELNRIELPDRELVSLFISLRAKMVNLRSELKADECTKDNDTKTPEIAEKREEKFKSRSLPRPSSHSDDTPASSRRFSWM